MNEMEEFLNFCAVVKIRREYDDDLYKFIKLMKDTGFLKEYTENFEKNCCFDKKNNEFSEDKFWYYVKLNNGNARDTCIEFQWSKGFTWGNRKEYLDYDKDIKILNIDQLIKACEKEKIFNMNYEKTTFQNELKDKESASILDDFLFFYEWSIVKYPDGKYNIKDEQCNTFDYEENTSLNTIIERVYFRMFDYFIDEEDIEGLVNDGDTSYVKNTFKNYMKIGEKLKLMDNDTKENYASLFQKITKDKIKEDEIEINNDI